MYGNEFLSGDDAYTYILVGDTTITPDDLSGDSPLQITNTLCADDYFSVGGFTAAQLTASISTGKLPAGYVDYPFRVYMGYRDDETEEIEAVPMGVFYVDASQIKTKGLYTDITAYDKSYFLTGEYTQPSGLQYVSSVVSNLVTAAGLTLATDAYSHISLTPSSVRIRDNLTGLTTREAIAHCAMLLGANACLDRTGKLTFVVPGSTSLLSYDADAYAYDDFEVQTQDSYTVARLEVTYTHEETEDGETVERTDYFIYQASGTESVNGFSVESIDLTSQAETDTLGAAIFGTTGIEFRGFSLKTGGRPEIDVGDKITITDVDDNTNTYYVLSHTITYSGDFMSTFSASTPDTDIIELNGANNRAVKETTKLTKEVSSLSGRVTSLEASAQEERPFSLTTSGIVATQTVAAHFVESGLGTEVRNVIIPSVSGYTFVGVLNVYHDSRNWGGISVDVTRSLVADNLMFVVESYCEIIPENTVHADLLYVKNNISGTIQGLGGGGGGGGSSSYVDVTDGTNHVTITPQGIQLKYNSTLLAEYDSSGILASYGHITNDLDVGGDADITGTVSAASGTFTNTVEASEGLFGSLVINGQEVDFNPNVVLLDIIHSGSTYTMKRYGSETNLTWSEIIDIFDNYVVATYDDPGFYVAVNASVSGNTSVSYEDVSLTGDGSQMWITRKIYNSDGTYSSISFQPQKKITTSNKLAYSLISGTPDIPTEETVSGWGFIKTSTGFMAIECDYYCQGDQTFGVAEPIDGKLELTVSDKFDCLVGTGEHVNEMSVDLSASVKQSLNKADTALQTHQTLKTINGQSIVGSGNIVVGGGGGSSLTELTTAEVDAAFVSAGLT